MPSEFLSFRLGKEEFGIDILRVQEIRNHEERARTPFATIYGPSIQ